MSVISRNDKLEQYTCDYGATTTAEVHVGNTATSMSLVGNKTTADTIRGKIVDVAHFGSNTLSIEDYAFANC